jgi:Zn-dependent protease with chaperone function
MDSSDFSVLVGRLERQSDDDPTVYAIKVGLVAALGYSLIGLTVVSILIACYFCIDSLISGGHVYRFAVLGFIAGVGTLIAIARALYVKIDPPSGRIVTREEAPVLFVALDDVLQRMAIKRKGRVHTIPIASVTLDNEFNASICQIPRWGVFGNYSNHLQIGIPLMATLDVAEFKTVLAHELGHLGGQHGRFSAWIYRQRKTWHALQRKFAEPQNVFDQVLAVFYRWYTPYFNAYTFVLARNHEYLADQAAALATNARVLGRALVKSDLAGRFLGEIFWERFYAQVEKSIQPPYLPYSMLPRALALAQKQWLRTDWLGTSLRRFASESDTHPGLGERLAALDVQAEMPSHNPDKSALTLFGAAAPALLKWCDDEWHATNAAAWRKRHDAIKEARWKIAQYENTPAPDLKPDDLWEKSLLLLDVGQEDEAIEELQALVILDPAVAKAQFLLGRLALDRGDESGLQHLILAAQRDEELLGSAGQIGYSYLLDRGRKGEAHRFWERCRAA